VQAALAGIRGTSIRSQLMRFSKLLPALFITIATGVSFAAAAEPVQFTIKFPPGEVDHQTSSMEMTQSASIEKLPVKRQQTMNMVAKTTLRQIKSDASGCTVELTYDGMQLTGSFFQSVSDELDKTLAAFIGQKLTLHFDPAGLVDKVEGVDAITSKLPPGTARVAVKAFLSDERIKDEFKTGIEQLLPKKPVSVGDTWETEMSHKMGSVVVKIKSQVKFVALDQRDGHQIARLEFTGKGTVSSSATAVVPTVSFNDLEQNGTAEFDLTRGWLTSQAVEQTMKGEMHINRLGAAPVTLALDQAVKAKTTTTLGTASEAKQSVPATAKPDEPSSPKTPYGSRHARLD
jgi:hypothetical protein